MAYGVTTAKAATGLLHHPHRHRRSQATEQEPLRLGEGLTQGAQRGPPRLALAVGASERAASESSAGG